MAVQHKQQVVAGFCPRAGAHLLICAAHKLVVQCSKRDILVMKHVEMTAGQHNQGGLCGPPLPPQRLHLLLQDLAMRHTSLRALPEVERLTQSLLADAIPHSKAVDVCNLFSSSIALGLTTGQQLQAMVQQLVSAQDKDLFRWLSTFVYHPAKEKSLRLGDADYALLGTGLQRYLQLERNPLNMSKLLFALSRLGQVPKGLDMPAVLRRFLKMERACNSQQASNVLCSLGNLFGKGA